MKAWTDSHGYPLMYVEGRRVPEHIYLAEKALGGPLPEGAEVHHFDENRANNSPQNLVICQDRSFHRLLHQRQRIVRAGGDPDKDRICPCCKTLKPIAEFDIIAGVLNLRCKICRRRIQRAYDARRRQAGRLIGKKRAALHV